jgi:phospholipid-binding lipoprotein MlaA
MPPPRGDRILARRCARQAGSGARLVAVGLALCTLGCASLASGPADDRLEPFNRAVFRFNDGLERHLIRPVARGYRAAVPEAARDGLRNLVRNLDSPVVLGNDILQGELRRAGQTLGRLVVNTVLGVGGIYEMGDRFGMPFHDEDFGQTLAVWGFPQGPYLVLPLLGPTSPRAGIGIVADSYLSPWNLWLDPVVRIVRGSLEAADTIDAYSRVMDGMEETRETSVDFYGTVRSLYLQKREEEIHNGRAPEGSGHEEIDYGLELEPAPAGSAPDEP